MDDKKTTLYLALLCVILIIWGSVLDGKRMHTKEVLEAENAELLSIIDETRAGYNEAKARQADLSRKLSQLQQQLQELRAENRELKELNEKLKAELADIAKLKEEAEKRAEALEAKSADCRQVSPAPSAPAVNPGYDSRLRELESRVDRLIRERDELMARNERDQEKAFANSLAVSELESQLKFCREQARQYQKEAGETAALRSRIRQLEWELSSRTQELWNTRLSMSADLDACTRRLMEASMPKPPPAPPVPCNFQRVEAGQPASNAGGCKCGKTKEQGCRCKECKKQKQNQGCKSCKKPGGKNQACNCQDCPKLKKLQEKLQAYSSRVEALQQKLYSSNLQSLEEIEELKRALKEKNDQCLKQLGATENNARDTANQEEQIRKLTEELQMKEKELSAVSAELEQYKKNTEALLEQIREQRAEIRRLKAGKK